MSFKRVRQPSLQFRPHRTSKNYKVCQVLIDTGENVQKWTIFDSALSHTRRSDVSEKREENSVSTFGLFRLWTSFKSSPVLVKAKVTNRLREMSHRHSSVRSSRCRSSSWLSRTNSEKSSNASKDLLEPGVYTPKFEHKGKFLILIFYVLESLQVSKQDFASEIDVFQMRTFSKILILQGPKLFEV